MAQSTMTYVLSHISQNIPPELLELAFKPRKYNTTVEQRIIAEIIEGPVLLDTNLVGGKRRDIYLQPQWVIPMDPEPDFAWAGQPVQGVFYKVPPEAREHRNISSVMGISNQMGWGDMGLGGYINHGNTVAGSLSEMLNTRTFANTPPQPEVTLEGTNMIRVYPGQIISNIAVSVMLEYDAEFSNMNQSAVFAMRNLCLCATQRYIANMLRVVIDESAVVAGMEIGVIKEKILDYEQKAEQYQDLLMKVKGAMVFDRRSMDRLIFHAL